MHMYLGAVGLKDYSRKQVERIMKRSEKLAVDNNAIRYCPSRKKASFRIPFSEKFGLNVICDCDNKGQLSFDYYMPYLDSDHIINTDSVYLEKHSYNDSYGLMYDDITYESTIVCSLDNTYELDIYEDKLGEIKKVRLGLSGFCLDGLVIMPVIKESRDKELIRICDRSKYVKEAKEGNREAIEYLAMENYDAINAVTKRMFKEDIYTIVGTTFIPCGVECDTYAVVGEILKLETYSNSCTGQEVYVMLLECHDLVFSVAVNKLNVKGEPLVGRRFKGRVWLTGHIDAFEK